MPEVEIEKVKTDRKPKGYTGVDVALIKGLIYEAKRNRELFDADWKEIIEQVNIKPPEAWSEKEDWQTKIYVPESAKIAETATAMIQDMIFPTGGWFDIIGVEKSDHDHVEYLKRFLTVLLDMARFNLHNGFVIDEGIRLGTSFLEVLVDPEPDMKRWKGLKMEWASVNHCGFDGEAIVDFESARYWFRERRLDIAEILRSDLYKIEAKTDLLRHLAGKSRDRKNSDDVHNVYVSEGDDAYKISKVYQSVEIVEIWGNLPVNKTKKGEKGSVHEYVDHEWRVVTIADDAVVLRDNENTYGSIPAVRMRVKRRSDHGYGYGFIWNIRGLQDLMNSMVNHGFDSAKINMPIAKFEQSAVADPDSIEMKPLAKWILRDGGIDKARIENIGTPNAGLIVNDVSLIDQFVQEASGVSRHSQGINPIFGREETLGQTEIKQQSVQQRFFKTAREINEDYVVPLLRKIYSVITQEEFVDKFQALADRILGMDESTEEQMVQTVDPNTGYPVNRVIPVPTQVSKLNLREIGQMPIDFRAVGVVDFIQKNEVLNKLVRLLNLQLSAPVLQSMSNMDVTFERIIKLADIPDHQELMKTSEERMEFMQSIMQGIGGENEGEGSEAAPLPGPELTGLQ